MRKRFTGYERDIESDLDFAQARYLNARLGRFTTTDPIMMTKDRIADPQRNNLFAYVRNNPLIFTDPDGMDLVLGVGDEKRIRKALVEIAKRPGGPEFLQKLDNLTIQIFVETGRVNGEDYERIGPKDGGKTSSFVPVRDDQGNITDVKGDALSVKLDTDIFDADKKENKKIDDINKAVEKEEREERGQSCNSAIFC